MLTIFGLFLDSSKVATQKKAVCYRHNIWMGACTNETFITAVPSYQGISLAVLYLTKLQRFLCTEESIGLVGIFSLLYS
jgi:hypothetical protein